MKPRAGGYDIPEGNLFQARNSWHAAEIYVMGNRNPFRISVDQKTGFLLGRGGAGCRWAESQQGLRTMKSTRRGARVLWLAVFCRQQQALCPVDYVARQKYQDAMAAREAAKKAGKPESGVACKTGAVDGQGF